MRYRSKPTEVEAMRWNDPTYFVHTEGDASADQIVDWINSNGGDAEYIPAGKLAQATNQNPLITIRTINASTCAVPGDYIVRDDVGFYPCDPVAFGQRWEPTHD